MKRLVCLSLLFAGFLTASCGRDPKRPGYEFLPDMAHSVPYDSFAPNPNFKDGKTLQAPPAGTIPRGFMSYAYGTTPEEAERAGRELVNPVAPDAAALARGEKVYRHFCLICHGEKGEGDGPLIPKYPNPPSFHTAALKNYSDGRLFHIITVGSGQMASYASQIKPADRWKLVHYLRKIQGVDRSAAPPETQKSPETQASPETRPQGGAASAKGGGQP